MKATVKFKGFEFDVQFDYEPAEDAIYNYGDGSGYPGYPESYDFWEIKLNNIDASDLLDHCIEEFEEEAIEQIKKQNSDW